MKNILHTNTVNDKAISGVLSHRAQAGPENLPNDIPDEHEEELPENTPVQQPEIDRDDLEMDEEVELGVDEDKPDIPDQNDLGFDEEAGSKASLSYINNFFWKPKRTSPAVFLDPVFSINCCRCPSTVLLLK